MRRNDNQRLTTRYQTSFSDKNITFFGELQVTGCDLRWLSVVTRYNQTCNGITIHLLFVYAKH